MAKKSEKVTVDEKNLSSLLSVDAIKSIFELMNQNEIGELDLEHVDVRIKIVGKNQQPAAAPATVLLPQAGSLSLTSSALSSVAPADSSATEAKTSASEAKSAPNVRLIRAPMVGTFYGRPSPDVSAFVAPGDEVTPETVVCLIEAMKLFNEIKAETTGKIVKVLVKDGTPVEFHQPLFEIED